TDLLPSLPGPVEELVERERQVRAIRDVELVLRPDAPLAEGVELGEEGLRIEHDAVADQAYRTLNDPRGNLVQHELPGAGVDRVACVRPTLIAHDEIGALGEYVDDLSLALVAPSRAARVSTRPSTSTGNQRARRAPRAVATRSMVGPARWTKAIVPPRSSIPSKLTMHVSPSRLARSRPSARAPRRPYSSASGNS